MTLVYTFGVKAKMLSDWLRRTEAKSISEMAARASSPAGRPDLWFESVHQPRSSGKWLGGSLRKISLPLQATTSEGVITGSSGKER